MASVLDHVRIIEETGERTILESSPERTAKVISPMRPRLSQTWRRYTPTVLVIVSGRVDARDGRTIPEASITHEISSMMSSFSGNCGAEVVPDPSITMVSKVTFAEVVASINDAGVSLLLVVTWRYSS